MSSKVWEVHMSLPRMKRKTGAGACGLKLMQSTPMTGERESGEVAHIKWRRAIRFTKVVPALVPKPRVNLTRYHGVLAPNSKHRINVTPAKRGKGSAKKLEPKDKKNAGLPVSERQKMTWAQRLKRVFNIDVTICNRCGGAVKIIACIEDPSVIKKILEHLDAKSMALTSANQLPEPRAPPQAELFD